MPLSYAVSEVEQLVRVSAKGVVSSDDLPLIASLLLADRGIVQGMQLLVGTENVHADLTFSDLRIAADTLHSLREKGVGHIAIVTDTTHVYALAQVFATFTPPSSVTVKVFRTYGEAGAWLKSQAEGLIS